jgi:hypothetical protein
LVRWSARLICWAKERNLVTFLVSHCCPLLTPLLEAVLAGVPFVDEVFHVLGCSVQWHMREGDVFEPVTRVATVRGPARHLLLGERVALNVLARCSGIATKYVFSASQTLNQCSCLGAGAFAILLVRLDSKAHSRVHAKRLPDSDSSKNTACLSEGLTRIGTTCRAWSCSRIIMSGPPAQSLQPLQPLVV